MKKQNNKDVLQVLANFKKILDHKPSVDHMYNEVLMMKFKIKPLQGDISLFNVKNSRLIEVLWSLGKLDELFQKEYRKLSLAEQEIFFKAFDEVHRKLQGELNGINLKTEQLSRLSPVVEMEIFKENLQKKTN